MTRRSSADLEQLLHYATDTEAEYIRAVISQGSMRSAARESGVHESVLRRAIARTEKRAALRGYSPSHDMTKTVPDGFTVKGVSTMYGPDGEVRAQWVKSRVEDEHRHEAMRLFVEELCSQVTPREPVSVPRVSMSDVMVGYPIGDHHYGMYAYAAETGADYDLKIAQQLLADAVDYLIANSPASETALFAPLGDLLHADNRKNMTPASGHILDVDSRYSKVIRVAAFGIAHSIERLLSKHQIVHVKVVPGNHDPDSTSWLSLVLEAWFRNEPRVIVDTSPATFLYHEFGRNMICLTHGHTVKLEEVPAVMVAQQPEMWGRAKYRAAWTGHVHHAQRRDMKETRGAKVESFGVLAPNDAYGASKGFVTNREMHAITFRKEGGELGRATYNAD